MSKPVEIGHVYDEQDTLIGSSRAMARVYRELAKIAATPVTVLIRGDTGTGKELIARALYQHGHRAHEPAEHPRLLGRDGDAAVHRVPPRPLLGLGVF